MKTLAKTTLVFLSTWVATSVAAQDTITNPKLVIELNTAQTTEQACRLSFLVTNEHPDEIGSAVFETVLFNADGSVNQLTLFDFGTLPSNRPRIRQFDVAGLSCDGLGSLLINGATTCGAADTSLCVNTLKLQTRTDIEVLG